MTEQEFTERTELVRQWMMDCLRDVFPQGGDILLLLQVGELNALLSTKQNRAARLDQISRAIEMCEAEDNER
jgi:hypothetical protein